VGFCGRCLPGYLGIKIHPAEPQPAALERGAWALRWQGVRFTRGLGTRAAGRAMKSSSMGSDHGNSLFDLVKISSGPPYLRLAARFQC
jgi:hypothetical protein